jgi:hypothetical protein
MKSSLTHRILLSMSMLLVLSTALISDRWLHSLILRTQSSFEGSNFLLLAHPAGHFAIAGLCIFLYWLVVQKSSPDPSISILFIGIGFLLPFYNILVFLFSSLNLTVIRFVYPISASNLHLTAGAFIVVIGCVNLFRGKNEPPYAA